MTVKNVTNEEVLDHDVKAQSIRDFPRIDNEAKALASMSSMLWWRKRKHSLNLYRNSLVAVHKTSQNFTKKRLIETSSVSLLFDISAEPKQSVGSINGTNISFKDKQEDFQPDQVQMIDQNLLNWNETQKNRLLAAYFWGYVIFMIPSGYAAELFGAKFIFILVGIGSGITTLIFPLACTWSDGDILLPWVVRFVMGASQAGLFPACYVLLAHWLPKTERSSWLGVPSSMGRLGTIIMNLFVPYTIEYFGWEVAFYICGVMTLVWGMFFLMLSSDSPRSSCWISQGELLYIEANMEPQVDIDQQKDRTLETGSGFTINEISPKKTVKKPPINWLKMITNKPLLILSMVMFTSEWSNFLLLVKLDGFLGPVLSMDVKSIALWKSILVGIYCVAYPLAGICAAQLEAAEIRHLNSLRIRKIFELLAHLMQAAGCLIIAFYVQDKVIVIIALCLIMIGRSTVGGGQSLMPFELSRYYPGSVMALANSIANSAGFIAPEIVSLIVKKPTDHEGWRLLFGVSAAIFIIGGIVFCILAENRPQNYSKKPKFPGIGHGISQAQLNIEEQIYKMDSFTRVGSEPSQSRDGPSVQKVAKFH